MQVGATLWVAPSHLLGVGLDQASASIRYRGQHLAQVERHIAELTRTHDVLIDLQRRAAAINPADCAEPEICSILITA